MIEMANDRFISKLKSQANRMPNKPGVYLMSNDQGKVIYVGKAKGLKNRVRSYFTPKPPNDKVEAILKEIKTIDTTVTITEREALILENTLIKKHNPKFNVLLKDGKSYPHIEVNLNHDFPKFAFHRGKKRSKHARYFGPYPNVYAVRNTLSNLQKIFLLRNCTDSYYKNRSRPCLQFQIKRCSAPCVEKISQKDYSFNVNQAVDYLKGNDKSIIDNFIIEMEKASTDQNYERAAFFRDQIANLKVIQSQQYVDGTKKVDADVISLVDQRGMYCLAVLFIRQGKILGSRSIFPSRTKYNSNQEILATSLMQFYLEHDIPREIILNRSLDGKREIEQALIESQKRHTKIKDRVVSYRAKWLKISVANAEESLKSKLASKASISNQLTGLTQALGSKQKLSDLVCFDVSHHMGDKSVAACVRLNEEGFSKKDYRRFNIEGVTPGDDYAAISNAVQRYYKRIKTESQDCPDLLIIDGGKGQINSVKKVLESLSIKNQMIIGIAKGDKRDPKNDRIFLEGLKKPIDMNGQDPAKFLVQSIRDEAHRFAITGHRAKKRKQLLQSDLESIDGIGPSKKRNLLTQFGGIQEVKRASVEDLLSVDGINKNLAKKIFNYFNPN
ncbi:MAG: excinuclease ABC subunit C [Gammaproteobacteria bacterium]|nr:excinuclease ABC subunit C [Gammaproteobacteria bacterium]OUT94358.1 MAG: excinuclease ABC subunit C [Gammaproteobacteria bacterium TMED36]